MMYAQNFFREDSPLLNELRSLRNTLHVIPELSWKENKTAQTVLSFTAKHCPGAEITHLTGTGFMLIIHGKSEGPVTVIRCELDGVPVTESADHQIRSLTPGVSHACGHDGHIAVSAGLAVLLNEHPPERGSVAILFQPAEETGEGAAAVMKHPSFISLNPDYIFGFHNIPGAPEGAVIVRDKTFASASRGMHITLTGTPAHAADPGAGNSPMAAALDLVTAIPVSAVLPARATATYIRIGSPDMGRAPFDADMALTLRAPDAAALDIFTESAEALVRGTAAAAGLKVSVSWSDIFPETFNCAPCTDIIREAAARCGLAIVEIHEPFLWSEDFGHYTSSYPGALFGIGSGSTPPLHDADYTFPDSLIEPALKLYLGIVLHIHGTAF